MNEDYMDIAQIISAISMLKTIHDGGNKKFIKSWSGSEFFYDDTYDMFWNAMHNAAEISIVSDADAYSGDKWYFADSVMTEYYRLARKLCKLKGIAKKNCPYARAALEEIRYVERNPYYDFSIALRTGIKRNYSSHILLYVNYELANPFDIAEYINGIFNFYRKEVKTMRKKYALLTAPARLEVAA